MKKAKFCALTLACALVGGALIGCGGGGSTPAPTPTKYIVTVPSSQDYTISGIEAGGYVKGAAVSFTVTVTDPENKEIKTVKYDTTTLQPTTPGNYAFTMPEKDVTLAVTLKNIDKYALSASSSSIVTGNKVDFTLTLGTDPVTTFTLDCTGTDRVIDGHSITFNALGEYTVKALVDTVQVATLDVTVTKAIETIQEAIDDAWENTTDFDDNTKSTYSTSKYKLKGQVLFMGSPYNSKVEMLVSDGTAIIDYSVKSSTAITKFAVGDWIAWEESLQNYKGLIETYSSDVKYITVVTGDPVTIDFKAHTGSQYDTVATSLSSGTEQRVITPMTIQVNAKEYDESGTLKQRYAVKDATVLNGKIATSKSAITLDWVKDAGYTMKGYALSANTSAGYINFVAVSQEKEAAKTVNIVEEGPIQLSINNTVQLNYEVTPTGAGKVIAWSSSDEAVATVEAGLVTAKAAGNATITLDIDGIKDTVAIEVAAALKPATGVSLDRTEAEVETGSTLTLVATVTPSDTTDAAVWTSSDEAVATVSAGVVTPVAPGTANIKVKYNDSVEATCAVTVKAEHGTTASDPLTADEAYAMTAALAKDGKTTKEYYVKGVVTKVTNAWANNIVTYYLKVEGGRTFPCYKLPATQALGEQVVVGAETLCHSQFVNYGGNTPETVQNVGALDSVDASKIRLIQVEDAMVNAGETLQLAPTTYPSGFTASLTYEASGNEKVTVSATGLVSVAADAVIKSTATITITEANGATESITITVSSASMKSVTMAYKGSSTGNMTDGNNASSVGLDEKVFNVTSAKNSASNPAGLNKDGTIRLYGANDGKGTQIKVAPAEEADITINKITVTLKSGSMNNVGVFVSGSAVTGTNGVFQIGASEFVLQNIIIGSTTQLQITSIVIVYTVNE